jgi:hypothetical protein
MTLPFLLLMAVLAAVLAVPLPPRPVLRDVELRQTRR